MGVELNLESSWDYGIEMDMRSKITGKHQRMTSRARVKSYHLAAGFVADIWLLKTNLHSGLPWCKNFCWCQISLCLCEYGPTVMLLTSDISDANIPEQLQKRAKPSLCSACCVLETQAMTTRAQCDRMQDRASFTLSHGSDDFRHKWTSLD